MEQPKIYGVVILNEDGKMELVTEFLSTEEEKLLWDILKKHETEGGSSVGTKEEILAEIAELKEPAGNILPQTEQTMNVGEARELLRRSAQDAPLAIAAGHKTFNITGGFVTGGTPYLESEDLLDYMEKYSME